MVKNKKLSKSSIAIIVLALLLIASLVMGMTGAWFTSRPGQKSSGTLKFGTVVLEVEGNWAAVTDTTNHPYLQTTNLMPGDTVNGRFDLTNTGDEAYVFMVYGGTVVRTFASLTAEEKAQLVTDLEVANVEALTEENTLEYRTEDLFTVLQNVQNAITLPTGFDSTETNSHYAHTLNDAEIFYTTLEKAGADESADHAQANFSIVLDGATFVDIYQGAEIEVHVEFVAVQAANLTADQAVAIAFPGYTQGTVKE